MSSQGVFFVPLDIADGDETQHAMEKLPLDVLDLVVGQSVDTILDNPHSNIISHEWIEGRLPDLYEELLRLCEVSRLWAMAAQPHLMKRVSFGTGHAPEKVDQLFWFVAATLPKWAPRIKSLYLDIRLPLEEYESVSTEMDDKLAFVLERLPSVSTVYLSYSFDFVDWYPNIHAALLKLNTVRHFAMNETSGLEATTRPLLEAYASNLRSLELNSDCPPTFFEALPIFGPQLQTFRLSGALGDAVVPAKSFGHLTMLSLSGSYSDTVDPEDIEGILKANAKTLRWLEVDGLASELFIATTARQRHQFGQLRGLSLGRTLRVGWEAADLVGCLRALGADQLEHLAIVYTPSLYLLLTIELAEGRLASLRSLTFLDSTRDDVEETLRRRRLQTFLAGRGIEASWKRGSSPIELRPE